MTRASRDVLADAVTVFGGEQRLPWTVIATRFAEQMPEQYADTTSEAVRAELRGLGVLSPRTDYGGSPCVPLRHRYCSALLPRVTAAFGGRG